MKNLIAFIEDNINFYRVYDKQPAVVLPLKQADVDEIAETIDCRLSPENLHCDGEISSSEANSKYHYLHRVFSELKAYVKQNGLTMPKTYEI